MTALLKAIAAAALLFCLWIVAGGASLQSAQSTDSTWTHRVTHSLWINRGNYRSPEGVHCCGPSDCQPLTKSDVRATDKGWRIMSLRETVPYSETLLSEDEDFWRCHTNTGKRRCFFAPPAGS